MGCHRLPRDAGSWARQQSPRLERICQFCATGALGDERHMIFECPGLQDLRAQWSHLFQGPETMQAFMWHDNMIGFAKFVNMCLHKLRGWKARREGGRQISEKFQPRKCRRMFEAGLRQRRDRKCGMTWQRLSKRLRRLRSEQKGEMPASSGVRRLVSGKCSRRGESGGVTGSVG